jgi:dihydropteroate synthase
MQNSSITEHTWARIADAYKHDKTLVMGILNVTPDSFSDGGAFSDTEGALQYAQQMVADGADIIDVGGESSRPGSASIPADTELERVLPVVKAIREALDIPISIDTRKARVAKAAIDSGANIINDISAMRDDPSMLQVAEHTNVPVILMHMKGEPAKMQDSPEYDDVVAELIQFFTERVAHCQEAGLTRLVVDPGVGFGKRLQDNLEILRRLAEFRSLELPLMLGTSRKSFIGAITGKGTDARRGGSIASAAWGASNGAAIVRVHDVLDTVSAIQTMNAVQSIREESNAV